MPVFARGKQEWLVLLLREDSMSGHEKDRIGKYHLSLAGEYRVASELLKRGLNATVTFGNAKSADVVAYGSNRRAIVVEVKTSQQGNFVTQFYNKYKTPTQQPHPDFWILVQVKVDAKGTFAERFFVLCHEELALIQAERNREYWVRCGKIRDDQEVTWEQCYDLTNEGHGVDNVLLANVEQHEDQWGKIVDACNA
jgi:hypothetical protein